MAVYGRSGKDLVKYLNNSKAVVNGESGLRNWRNKLKALKGGGTSLLNINFLGDSITAGTGANAATTSDTDEGTPWATHWSNSFVGLIRSYFQSIYGDVGDGLIHHTWWYSPDRIKMTYDGTWTHTNGDMGWAGESQTTGSGATVTTTFNGTGVRIFYRQSATSSNFTVQIDGGDVNTITNSSPTIMCKNVDFTGLEDGEHTVVITNLATAGRTAFRFNGLMELNNVTSGVRVNNMGVVGAGGVQNWLPATNSVWLNNITVPIPPDLTIIHIGTNDANSSASTTDFATAINATVNALITAGSSVLIVIPAVDLTPSKSMVAYNAILRNAARTYGAALLDMGKLESGSADGTGGYIASGKYTMDKVHPNIAGHSYHKERILKLIT